MSIFKFKDLPDTVCERFMMLQLIMCGKAVFFEDDGKFYCLNGNVGGEPNVYYEPSYFIVANPIIGSRQLRIRNRDGSDDVEPLDGVLIALTDVDYETDTITQGGLYGLIYKYAGLLADNDVSINCAQLNGRISTLFTADSEAMARTGEEILKEIYEGKPYKILDQDLVEKFTATPIAASGTNNTIMSLIEAHAYILQNFYAEIGIASQGNLKRERVNTAETELMTGCLDINIYNMLSSLKKAIDRINEKWQLNISVELNDEIFYAGSQNATLGVVEELAQSDNEAQLDGIVEDEVEQEPEKETIEDTEQDGDDDDTSN